MFVGVDSVPATLFANGDTSTRPSLSAWPSLGSSPGRGSRPTSPAQLVGAIIGAAAILGVLGMPAIQVGLGVAAFGVGVGPIQAFVAEFVGTFILVFTVFGVIHRKAAVGFAGLAIGLVVFAAIIPVAPATGASINPAHSFGPMLVQQLAGGAVEWPQLPVYLLAEFSAGVAAALVYTVPSRTRADRTAPAPAAAEDRVHAPSNA